MPQSLSSSQLSPLSLQHTSITRSRISCTSSPSTPHAATTCLPAPPRAPPTHSNAPASTSPCRAPPLPAAARATTGDHSTSGPIPTPLLPPDPPPTPPTTAAAAAPPAREATRLARCREGGRMRPYLLTLVEKKRGKGRGMVRGCWEAAMWAMQGLAR
ncbi:unnamed protein product [Closterium sp. NIES-53]